jgi:hypothetical protein
MPDQTAQGAPDLARITELVRLADRLGLTWALRPGTVVSVSAPYSRREASVRMDGDDGGITVVSLVGDVVLGDRVMVVWVPPSGQYAIGLLNQPSSQLWAAASTANSGTVIAEAVVLTIPSVALKAGTAYRVEAGPSILALVTISTQFRVRRTNLAGAIWATSPQFLGAGIALNGSAQWTSFIAPTVNVNDSLVLTMAATLTGSIHAGSAAAPRFVSVTPVGRAVDFPQAVPVS